MKLAEIYEKNGKKWEDGAVLENLMLGVEYFSPRFSTNDGIVVGLNGKGGASEFHLNEHDGWKIKSDVKFTDFYIVKEVFKKDDKKYYNVNAKEWHKTLDGAVSAFTRGELIVTKVVKESKPEEWSILMDAVIINSNEHGSDDGVDMEEILK